MKDFGIVTIFYKNYNAGGLLQAYALQKVITSLGYSCELISYDRTAKFHHDSSIMKRVMRIIKIMPQKVKNKLYSSFIAERRKEYEAFMDLIPHSPIVYTQANIQKANHEYRGFICGSDQIWNPEFATDIDFLTFAVGRKKIAYAASVGVKSLDLDVRNRFQKLLSDFDGISVRECNSIGLLEGLKKIEYVVDPTMLITKEEWDVFAEAKHTSEKYIFAYFLGDSKKQRDYVERYAQKHNLHSVTFRHVKLQYRSIDKDFCDRDIKSGGPKDFVRCIRDAEVIITDSFHAVVFSIIFEKQFYIINRFMDSEPGSQNTRLFDVLKQFGISDRQINDEGFDLPIIEYDTVSMKVQKQRIASLQWLSNQLQG